MFLPMWHAQTMRLPSAEKLNISYNNYPPPKEKYDRTKSDLRSFLKRSQAVDVMAMDCVVAKSKSKHTIAWIVINNIQIKDRIFGILMKSQKDSFLLHFSYSLQEVYDAHPLEDFRFIMDKRYKNTRMIILILLFCSRKN